MNPLLLFSLLAAVAGQHYCPSFVNLPPEGEKCFLFSSRPEEFKLDFLGAQNACQNYGGSLASITSKKESDFVSAKTKNTTGVTYRIGLIRGSNRWMDGSIYEDSFGRLPAGLAVNMAYPTGVISYGDWTFMTKEGLSGFVCSTWYRPVPSAQAQSICPYGGTVVKTVQTYGYSGCPYGFYGTPNGSGHCCVACPKGGVPLFVDNCPSATHQRNSFNNYCCPKNP